MYFVDWEKVYHFQISGRQGNNGLMNQSSPEYSLSLPEDHISHVNNASEPMM